MLQDYFDKVYLVNLPEQKERLSSSYSECDKLGIKFDLFKAKSGKDKDVVMNGEKTEGWNRNAASLSLNTSTIIEDAKLKGYKSIFIMEDDVAFEDNFTGIFKSAYKDLPEDWHFFHLNTTHEISTRYVKGCLHRIGGAWCCQAYAINHLVYDIYLEELYKRDRPIDHITYMLQKDVKKSYCTVPNIVKHYPDRYSTLRERIVKY